MYQIERLAFFIRMDMRILQAIEHANRNSHCLMYRQYEIVLIGKTQNFAQIRAIDEFHRHEQRIVHHADLIDANDIRMFERETNSRLVDKHLHEFCLPDERWQNAFNRQNLAGLGIACTEYLRHATDIDAIQYFKLRRFFMHLGFLLDASPQGLAIIYGVNHQRRFHSFPKRHRPI